MSNFVYANKSITQDNIHIRQYEIGIIIKEDESKCLVNFVNNNVSIPVEKDFLKSFDPYKTGDQFPKKVCNVCHRLLDVKEFQKNQNGKNNRTVRRPSCNDCRKTIDGVSMTTREVNEMRNIKPHMEIWTCPICQKTTIPGLTSKVVIDHNHKTGHPRAWICDSCNTGLGRFKDDVKLLERAIEYLKSSK